MKTPSANIFVWGLLEDTTKDDIVADLSLSGITVTESDIEMKSKPESRMKCTCPYSLHGSGSFHLAAGGESEGICVLLTEEGD